MKKLKRFIVIQNESSGEYFTNDCDNWWSRDIKNAFFFNNQKEAKTILLEFKDSMFDPFKNVDFFKLLPIFRFSYS